MLDSEVKIVALPTVPFVTSSVSATLEHEGGDQTDSVAGAYLQTINAPQRFVISSDSSHHLGANVAEAEVDSVETPIKPSLLGAGSSSTSGTDPTPGSFFDVSGSKFLVGGIRTIVEPDFDLQKVYVSQWSINNGSRLYDGRVCREMLDEFYPLKFFASIRGIKHDQLFIEFNVGAARQISLSTEVRMHAEYNIKEKRRLRSIVDEKTELLKVKDGEIENFKAQLLLKEAEAAEAIRLRAEVSKFEAIEKSLQDEVRILKDHNTTLEKEKSELDVKVADLAALVKVREQEAADLDTMVTSAKSWNGDLIDQVHRLETSSVGLQEKVTVYEDYMSQLEKFQDERMEVMYEKFKKLNANFSKMALHLEENFYPHLLTTIAGRRWLLTYGMKLAIVKCLNSSAYLSILRELSAKARSFALPSTEMQDAARLASVALIHLLFVPHIPGQDGLGSCLIAVDTPPRTGRGTAPRMHISNPSHQYRVQRIRENIVNNRLALHDIFFSFSKPLSIVALECTEGNSGAAPDTTTALSTTYASASSIPPIFTDDYVVVHADNQESTGADGQAGIGANVNPFPNIDNAELDISQ
ncbi:hypothetical protein Tco_1248872 [Tanacetum coccineum]